MLPTGIPQNRADGLVAGPGAVGVEQARRRLPAGAGAAPPARWRTAARRSCDGFDLAGVDVLRRGGFRQLLRGRHEALASPQHRAGTRDVRSCSPTRRSGRGSRRRPMCSTARSHVSWATSSESASHRRSPSGRASGTDEDGVAVDELAPCPGARRRPRPPPMTRCRARRAALLCRSVRDVKVRRHGRDPLRPRLWDSFGTTLGSRITGAPTRSGGACSSPSTLNPALLPFETTAAGMDRRPRGGPARLSRLGRVRRGRPREPPSPSTAPPRSARRPRRRRSGCPDFVRHLTPQGCLRLAAARAHPYPAVRRPDRRGRRAPGRGGPAGPPGAAPVRLPRAQSRPSRCGATSWSTSSGTTIRRARPTPASPRC